MSQRKALIYLAFRPQETARRIERFFGSMAKSAPEIDFHVVTFDLGQAEQVKTIALGGIRVPQTVYNMDSVLRLVYPKKYSPTNLDFKVGQVDLPVILFSLAHPEYEGLWVMEDDVEYTGDFGALLRRLEDSNDDAGLACTHLRLLPDGWDHTPMYSSGPDVIPAGIPKRVCFLPFFRVTREALRCIHQAYERGWSGHNEMTWAIILDFVGIRIRDIGGDGPYVDPADRNRCYIDKAPNDFQKWGSFGTMEIRLFPGKQKDKLWHPVKTLPNYMKMNYRRALSIYKWYRNQWLPTPAGGGQVRR